MGVVRSLSARTRLSRSSASSGQSSEHDCFDNFEHQEFEPGCLVVISAWECEGVQQPFSFAIRQIKNIKVAAKKIPLGVGTFGVVIDRGESDNISHTVLINGRQLVVMNRFLRRVQVDDQPTPA